MKTFSRTIELTKAQIDGANSTPITLLTDGLPTGKAFVITGAQLWKTAGDAATAGTGHLEITYGTSSDLVLEFQDVDAADGALGDDAQNRIQYALVQNTKAIACSSEPVVLNASAAILCAANTTVKIKLDCQVIDL